MSDETERLLRELSLRRPSAALDKRVLGRPGGASRARWAVAAGVFSAAAALIVLAVVFREGQPSEPAHPAVVQQQSSERALTGRVRLEQDFSQVWYEGVVTWDDHTPLRKYRRRTVRRLLWIDEERGFLAEIAEPEEQVILIAAEVH